MYKEWPPFGFCKFCLDIPCSADFERGGAFSEQRLQAFVLCRNLKRVATPGICGQASWGLDIKCTFYLPGAQSIWGRDGQWFGSKGSNVAPGHFSAHVLPRCLSSPINPTFSSKVGETVDSFSDPYTKCKISSMSGCRNVSGRLSCHPCSPD